MNGVGFVGLFVLCVRRASAGSMLKQVLASVPLLTLAACAGGNDIDANIGTQTSALEADAVVVPADLPPVPANAVGCWASPDQLAGLSNAAGCTIDGARLQMVSTSVGLPSRHQEVRLVVDMTCPSDAVAGTTVSVTMNIPFGMQGANICEGLGTVESSKEVAPENAVALYQELVRKEAKLNQRKMWYSLLGAEVGCVTAIYDGSIGVNCRDLAQVIYETADVGAPPPSQCAGLSGANLACCSCCESSGATGYNSYTNPLWFDSCSCPGASAGTCSSP